MKPRTRKPAPERERSRERESTKAVLEREAQSRQKSNSVAVVAVAPQPDQRLQRKRKQRKTTNSNAYIRANMHRTQRHHDGTCIKYRPMRRIVKSALLRVEYGHGVTQVTESAVMAVQELAESAVISILRQAIERREENGGKKLMEQNILNSFLNWASFQELDFVQDFADMAKALDFTPLRPKFTQQNFLERADFKRPRLLRDA